MDANRNSLRRPEQRPEQYPNIAYDNSRVDKFRNKYPRIVKIIILRVFENSIAYIVQFCTAK